nr:uncharacterized protein LOC117691647 [Crassostrea gigas]
MENILSLLIASVFLVTTKGQCPLNVGNKLITTCSETTADGPLIYIDFFKINRPCLCTVTSRFSGNLLVTAQEIRISSCSTQVVVNGRRIFGCPLSQGTSVTFWLRQYQSIAVQAEFIPPSSSGNFYQCLGFQQNGGKGRDIAVLCDIPSGTTTRSTRSYTASPTRKTTSSLSLPTRKLISPLTSPTRKTTSPVTSTRTTRCLLSTTSKIKLASTSQSAVTANTKNNKQSTSSSSYTVQLTCLHHVETFVSFFYYHCCSVFLSKKSTQMIERN